MLFISDNGSHWLMATAIDSDYETKRERYLVFPFDIDAYNHFVQPCVFLHRLILDAQQLYIVDFDVTDGLTEMSVLNVWRVNLGDIPKENLPGCSAQANIRLFNPIKGAL